MRTTKKPTQVNRTGTRVSPARRSDGEDDGRSQRRPGEGDQLQHAHPLFDNLPCLENNRSISGAKV